MKGLKNSYWRHWIKRHGCKFGVPISELPEWASVSLEPGVSISNIEVQSRDLTVGHSTYIRSGVVLAQVNSIGRYCSVGVNAMIGLARDLHPIHWVTTHPFAESSGRVRHSPALSYTTIGHDVWVGRDVLVMSGVVIGTGSVIAAGSVVVKDVPPYSVVGGNPAKVIKYRFTDQMVAQLLASNWWDIDRNVLTTLPLNDPGAFIESLEGNEFQQASYARVEISRARCRYVGA